MTLTSTALTLAAAAKLAGIDKSTLRRAVKAGKVSAVRDDHGVWRVEACEVARLYPLALPSPEGAALRRGDAVGGVPRLAPPDVTPELEKRLSDALAALAEMKAQRDAWQAMAERLSLGPPRPATRRWWGWLRSTKKVSP